MRIYVGNMPFSMNEAELRGLFEAHGQVESVDIVKDRETGRPRGFGFVEMQDEAAAQKAIAALNDFDASGRRLNVNQARPREERGGKRRGPGGGRRNDQY